ncbi:MAG: hypothetical protein JJ863_01150 [Deltaproteobacteria bacterium]|nr:hypothetical protein [Deltaproteobacteria bacterium]
MEAPTVIRLQPAKGLGERLETRRLVYMGGVVAACVVGAAFFPAIGFGWALGALALSSLALFMFRVKLRIGDDGMGTTGDGFPDFVSWAEVDAIAEDDVGLRLILRDGKELHLPDESSRALRSMIEKRWKRFRDRPQPDPPAALFEEDAEESAGGYRTAEIPLEALLEVASDPRVSLPVRQRAARRASERSERGRARVRVLADHHVDPEAREALLRVVDSSATTSATD